MAAILFPVFAQAREKARQATCASNLKQMITGALMYIQDYDETWPITAPANRNSVLWTVPPDLTPTSVLEQRQSFWANAIQPYVKNWGVYTCPSSASEQRTDVTGVSLSETRGISVSYTLNGYLNAWPMAGSPAPARVIAFAEGIGKGTLPGRATVHPLPSYAPGCTAPPTLPGGAVYRFNPGDRVNCSADAGVAGSCSFTWQRERTWWVHSQGSNYAYMDGHVAWVRNSSSRSPWSRVDDRGVPTSNIWVASASTGWCNTWSYNYGPTIQ
jgi:prepilin-type processing-associated H-X9-DG protein